ncbi:M56 family metallopeptidase [Pedobacter aquatilis]|uniref:M56 family metallopeptidase n=1 Tax=Pedobacter aquatilis TaxID=351343 RepID=UPI00292D42D9|nr:M56 family metallopeptidase [Pedobacter aquatilis]
MKFNLTDFFALDWLNAFGAMLFHSLWLGVILSFLVAVIIFFTRNGSANLRYNLLISAMVLFVASVSFVFYNAFDNQNVIEIHVASNLAVDKSSSQINTTTAYNVTAGFETFRNIWNAYSPQIVLLWFIVICIKSIQLFVGLNGVYHLRKTKVYSAGKIWEDKLDTLAHQFGISRKVKIVQSGLAQAPMVIGHLKPLVLIPLGLLNSISIAEVEAILCHELAHIKRKDYLVNLLQSFVEIIFFFNPAVIWVSKLIREERENCCDDLAVAKVENKKSYVKALIVCQEFQLNAPKYAMAFSNKKSPLFERVSRMLFDNKKTLNKMEKTILSAALVSVVVFSAAFKNLSAKDNHAKNTAAFTINQPAQSLQDSLKNKLAKQKADADKKQAEKLKANVDLEKEIALRMESQELKDKEIKADAARKLADEKYVEDQKKYDEHQKQYDAEQKKYDAEQKRYDLEQKRYDLKQKQMETDQKLKTAMQKSINNAREKAELPVPPTPPSHGAVNVPPATPTPPSVNIDGDVSVSVEQNSKKSKSNSKVSVKTGTQRVVESVTSTDTDDHDYKGIIKDLIKDGIIKTQNKLSYKLDKDNFIINGVKQNSSFHQKYKSKYLPKNNSALLYEYEESN